MIDYVEAFDGSTTTAIIMRGAGRPIHVEWYHGLFRDEVRAWMDIRPAAGGSLGRITVWRKGDRGKRLYNAFLANILATLDGQEVKPVPRRFR